MKKKNFFSWAFSGMWSTVTQTVYLYHKLHLLLLKALCPFLTWELVIQKYILSPSELFHIFDWHICKKLKALEGGHHTWMGRENVDFQVTLIFKSPGNVFLRNDLHSVNFLILEIGWILMSTKPHQALVSLLIPPSNCFPGSTVTNV